MILDNRLKLDEKALHGMNYHLKEAEKQQNDFDFQNVLEQYGFNEAEEVLDVGCGIGQTLWLLSGDVKKKVGVDIDWRVLEAGLELGRLKEEGIMFIQASGLELPFKDLSFSHVICRVTLNYIKSLIPLKELCRVTKNGGRLYLHVEAIGFDLELLRKSKSVQEFISRLYDLLCGAWFNITGKSINLFFVKSGRLFYWRKRLERVLNSNNMRLAFIRFKGKNLCFSKSLDTVACKSA